LFGTAVLISASWVAGITGVNHQHQAPVTCTAAMPCSCTMPGGLHSPSMYVWSTYHVKIIFLRMANKKVSPLPTFLLIWWK
jgi:hypothetical protein